jgi:hypothetical protein
MQRFIAETLDRNYKGNQKQIKGMLDLFNIAVLALGVEVVSWAAELA